jgi:UDP-galactopyranose mutase
MRPNLENVLLSQEKLSVMPLKYATLNQLAGTTQQSDLKRVTSSATALKTQNICTIAWKKLKKCMSKIFKIVVRKKLGKDMKKSSKNAIEQIIPRLKLKSAG